MGAIDGVFYFFNIIILNAAFQQLTLDEEKQSMIVISNLFEKSFFIGPVVAVITSLLFVKSLNSSTTIVALWDKKSSVKIQLVCP